MIFSAEQKGSLISRISFLESELKELKEQSNIEWKGFLEDKPRRRNIERMIENIVNALVDISKIVLSDKGTGAIPTTYAEVVLKLSEIKIIRFETAEKLAEYVKLRNFLAHQYLDMRWDKVKRFLRVAPVDFEQFIEQIKKVI